MVQTWPLRFKWPLQFKPKDNFGSNPWPLRFKLKDHFFSNPSYYGFNKERFAPNQERSEYHLSLQNDHLPIGPTSRKRGRGKSLSRPQVVQSQRQHPQVGAEQCAPIKSLPHRGKSYPPGHSFSTRGRKLNIRGRGVGYAPSPWIPRSVHSKVGLLIYGEDIVCPGCGKVVRPTDGTAYVCPKCNLEVQWYLLAKARESKENAEKGPHPETAADVAAGKFKKN